MKTKWNSIGKQTSAALLLLGIFAYTGCVKDNDDDGGGGRDEKVTITDVYSPASITIKKNTTVKWTNDDDEAHTVTSDADIFDSGTIDMDESYSYKFTTTGTFAYHCTFHSGMKGTVIVE